MPEACASGTTALPDDMSRNSPFRRLPPLWGRASRAASVGVLAAVLAGCATPPLPGQVVQVVPEHFREAIASPESAAAASRAPGWQVFDEPALHELLLRAERDNPGLQRAAARRAQAAAALRAAGAEAGPQLRAAVGAARQTGALVNAAGEQGNLFTADLSLRVDLDPARRLSRSEQAAGLDLQARDARVHDARLALQAELAAAWLQWRHQQLERPLQRQLVELDAAIVAQAESRVRAGLALPSIVGQARAELRDDEAAGWQLDRRQALLVHAMATLSGDTRWQPDAAALSLPGAAPALPTVPPGLPSTLLQRRADVAAADAELQAARVRLGLARDAWFPQLALTVDAGLASADLGHWLKAAARSTGLGLLLALPVFDGGRADAARQAAEAALQQAAAEHRARVLDALREVDDQLATLRTLAGEAALRDAAVADAVRDADRLASLRASGLASDHEALLARRQLLRQQRARLQVQAARHTATVALLRALGGGFGDPVSPPSRHAALHND